VVSFLGAGQLHIAAKTQPPIPIPGLYAEVTYSNEGGTP